MATLRDSRAQKKPHFQPNAILEHVLDKGRASKDFRSEGAKSSGRVEVRSQELEGLRPSNWTDKPFATLSRQLDFRRAPSLRAGSRTSLRGRDPRSLRSEAEKSRTLRASSQELEGRAPRTGPTSRSRRSPAKDFCRAPSLRAGSRPSLRLSLIHI